MGVTRRLRVIRSTEDEQSATQALKIAFASSDSTVVDQHLGSAKAFSLFEVTPVRADLVDVYEFGVLSQDGDEDKLDVKLSVLEGCTAVYCQAAGPSAIKRLMSIGVQPVKVTEGSAIAELMSDIQQEMKNGPTGWLAKAMEKHSKDDSERFDDMEAEGWDE